MGSTPRRSVSNYDARAREIEHKQTQARWPTRGHARQRNSPSDDSSTRKQNIFSPLEGFSDKRKYRDRTEIFYITDSNFHAKGTKLKLNETPSFTDSPHFIRPLKTQMNGEKTRDGWLVKPAKVNPFSLERKNPNQIISRNDRQFSPFRRSQKLYYTPNK